MRAWWMVLWVVAMNAGAVAQTAEVQGQALRDARRLAELLTNGDGDGAAAMIHPKALAAMGGSEAVATTLIAGPQWAKQKGITIQITVPSPPDQIEQVGQRLFASVRTRTRMASGTGSADLNGFWLGVSEDGGAHWSFVVFQDVINAQEDARKLFPSGTGALVFPSGSG